MQILRQANNAIVLSGDTHNAWGNQLIGDNWTDFVGVELATPGVSAPGLEEYLTTTLAPLASNSTILETIVGVQTSNSPDFTPENSRLPFLNITDRGGYMLVTITPNNVTNEWRFVSSVSSDNFTLLDTQSAVVPVGTKRIQIQ